MADLSHDFFHKLIKNETVKLRMECKKWGEILKMGDFSNDAIGDINVAIGQSNLFLKERFPQFEGLIKDSEFNTGEKEITLQDLGGFWDILNIQVVQLTENFKKLQRLKENNWEQNENLSDSKKIILKAPQVSSLKRKAQDTKGPKAKVARKNSNLLLHIMAARKKLKQEQEETNLKQETGNQQVKEVTENLQNEITPQIILQENKENVRSNENLNNVERLSEKCNKKRKKDREETLQKNAQTMQEDTETPQKDAETLQKDANTPQRDAVAMQTDTPKVQSESFKSIEGGKMKEFDGGFFKVRTPIRDKKKVIEKKVSVNTPVIAKRQRVKVKDYSPCMRVTRSMKKRSANNFYKKHF